MHIDPHAHLTSQQLVVGVGLAEVLPLLVGVDRTGRLSTAQDDGSAFEVWIKYGRVVDAAWGQMRALTALEMGAVFLAQATFVFSEGLYSQTRAFDLSPTELAYRLTSVAQEGGALAKVIPGPLAVPVRVESHRSGPASDPEAARLLDRIDGCRSVAELVEGRQPLVVLRGLASLITHGIIDFQRVHAEPAGPPPETSSIRAVAEPTTSAARQPNHHTRELIVGVGILLIALITVYRLQTVPPEATVPAAAPLAAAVPTVAEPPTTVPAVAEPPTAVPTVVQSPTAVPTVVESPTAAATAAQPTAVAQPVARTVLDESFSTGAAGWPNAATSSAWWDSLGYHLEPRLAGQHVAIAAPATQGLRDVTVTGLFRKRGGPAGGGFGLILRAQGGPLDGTNQGGRYYVFEVGDRGEVGAWRRDEDQWVDLLPWTSSNTVNPGVSENRLDVRAVGSQFTFSVNSAEVAQVTDATLAAGAVGVFTGGDGNQVLLERFNATAL